MSRSTVGPKKHRVRVGEREAREEIMPYCTRLTVTTAIRKTIESIRIQTQDHDRFDPQLKTFAVNIVYFIDRNLTGSYSDFLTSTCVELLESILVAIMAYFQDLKDRLEVFKVPITPKNVFRLKKSWYFFELNGERIIVFA